MNASQARLIALLNEDDDPDSADPAIKPSLAPLIWPVPTSHSHQPAPDLNGAMQAMDIESGEVSEAMSIDSNSDSGIADVHSSADDALLTGTELATRTLLALEMHDAHARQSMAFYEEALPRRGGAVVPQTAPAGGTTATGFDFGVQSPVVGRSGEERRASVAAAGGEGRQSAGVYDSARDPRLAGFNGGSASQMIPEPVEERSVSGAGGPPSGTYDRTRDPRLSRR